ncbi:MAG: glycosyltransferase family 1 protein [Candidatus Moranbacteria bacterium]|nr:glycosyltransferase family 1 protein [Candidatus Moranbacteria bacterium]
MRIAIQAADLDHKRIDGTRVYLLNVLKWLGKISPADEFLIYHRRDFNPELCPPNFPNYRFKKADFPFFWTQTRFARELCKDKPDVLWMPMHNIPILRRKGLKTVVTIHDLAFKYFSDHFPKKELLKLNFLADLAIKKSDKIIAVSQSTKRDILKFYPGIKEEKVRVIYHGFDSELFQKEISEDKIKKVLKSYHLQAKSYILYVGAIQPRKNLETLIETFNFIKKEKPELKLVLAGEKAWLWEGIIEKIEKSPYQKDIILTGGISFEELAVLYQNAALFVFPSLYEGFGIPVLEAFAAGVPVVCSRNSSLPEVSGDAALYFSGSDMKELADTITRTLKDEGLKSSLISKGLEQLKKFSWEKCARETLEYLKS